MREGDRGVGAVAVAAGLLAAVAASAPAQQAEAGARGPGDGEYATPADSAATADRLRQLAVDTVAGVRPEPFVYPLGGRRSPFRSPAAAGGAGPAFGDLTLAGIIYAPETGSVAIVSHAASGRRHRLRVGDRVGEARLVEIGPRRAVFEVTAYGAARRAVLTLGAPQER